MRGWLALVVALPVALATAPAGAQQDAGAAPPPGLGGACIERIPQGSQRPKLTDHFPLHGTSGYAATLEVTVEHGKGESVLPRGLELQAGSETAKALKESGFVFPDQDGGAGAQLTVLPADPAYPDRATTKLELPLLLLPSTPGRHLLALPPLPVTVARANGETMTVCTTPHAIAVEDPTASTPDAQPKPNPPPRPQREEWTTLRRAVEWGAVGVLLGGLIAYALYRYMKRPKPVPPPPPPRPAWEVALERLDEVRHAGLLETGRYSDYFDRVNDAIRGYLGARYGFDGLESTTDEILHAMKELPTFGLALPEIAGFLQECDLVKFANMTPSTDECQRVLAEGERIVRATMPKERAFASDPTEVRP